MADGYSLKSVEVELDEANSDDLVRAERGEPRGRNRRAKRPRPEGPLGSLPPIKFRATLSERSALKVGNEGAVKVALEVPASDLAEVLKLVIYQNRVFTVTVETE